MKTVRSMSALFVIAALPGSWAFSQDKPAAQAAPTRESLETVKKEYEQASNAWRAELRVAQEEARKKGLEPQFVKIDKPDPSVLFSPRFLSIAAQDPQSPDAIEALRMTLISSNDHVSGAVYETRAKAVEILERYYVEKPSIIGLLGFLSLFDEPDTRALLAEVIARNPDRNVQVAAYKHMIAHRESWIRHAESLKDPERREALEKRGRKDLVEEWLAKGERARRELDPLKQTVREKYGDLVKDLSIGNAAPEITMQSLDGTEARLSALKGKVVVLDIWTTWCGPCKAMIPHEREMVERLKDKPFVLVSISGDEKKETLIDFLSKEKMPWTHWWNGREGGIMDDWDVRYFPTIYVIDARGVIRHKDLSGDELEKAVNALLAEKPEA